MEKFKKITIVGVGLLGGSIGLAVKKKRLASEVVGFFRNRKKIPAALKAGVIDHGTDDFREAVNGSDFIILCSPVSDIIAKIKLLKKIAPKKTLVTDTGSSKEIIVKAAGGLNFVGSHPLAGSEQSGIAAASKDLFVNAACVITPTPQTLNASLKRVDDFWKNLGSSTVKLTPEQHDLILAYSSHLPHIMAFALIKTIPKNMAKLSAGGLKDTTRIALSSPDIWLDIFLSNRKNVLKSISGLEKSLALIKKSLANDNRKSLLSLLKDAQSKRRNLSQKS